VVDRLGDDGRPVDGFFAFVIYSKTRPGTLAAGNRRASPRSTNAAEQAIAVAGNILDEVLRSGGGGPEAVVFGGFTGGVTLVQV
jgi:hypothetical protein